ncbi:MAG: L,D-transpeptidase [Alphaproteobacteria bacterium]|nr:L,D-transpeptidase [Alphaproteobacteria bacterium]
MTQDALNRMLRLDPPSHVVRLTLTPPEDRVAASNSGASVSITILPDLSPESAPVPPLPEPPVPQMAEPRIPNRAPPDIDIARNDLPFIPMPPPLDAPINDRATAVAIRLRAQLTPEMLQGFDLFLYISKAERGPLAQRMYVFRKTRTGELNLLYDWAASTGREQNEVTPRGVRSFTATPAGYYQIDPDRMYRAYHSASWDQDMPHSLFFSWEREGLQTGLAIHAATGDDVARLGRRASAGCVHLSPQNAATLYQLIRADYRGPAPRFSYNPATQTMSNRGAFMHDAAGRLKMTDGYRVLVDIEDYGGENIVASLF